MLYMDTTKSRPDDRTARARIRDAALLCFARDGFSTPLRVIAAEAGVSVPLITHHYRTKDALRQTCDDWVLERFVELKLLAIARPTSVKETLADTSASSVLTVYMLRSFLDATSSAHSFFDRFVDHLRTILDTAGAAGLIRPSADEEERLRLLAAQSLGSLLVEFVVNPVADPRLFIGQVHTARNMRAQIELYSQPLFTASPAFDTYAALIGDDEEQYSPPAGQKAPAPRSPGTSIPSSSPAVGEG